MYQMDVLFTMKSFSEDMLGVYVISSKDCSGQHIYLGTHLVKYWDWHRDLQHRHRSLTEVTP